jgi:hypothetical protein
VLDHAVKNTIRKRESGNKKENIRIEVIQKRVKVVRF